VAVPIHSRRRSSRGVIVHRRTELRATTRQGVPTTTIEDTLIDLATELSSDALAGLTALRFTDRQVEDDATHVEALLRRVAAA
jgi:hypothetical protein